MRTTPRAASPLPPSGSRRGAHPGARQSRFPGCLGITFSCAENGPPQHLHHASQFRGCLEGFTRITGAPWRAVLGIALVALLMLTPLRAALEASMSRHMLVQFPALMLAGALLGPALPSGLARRLAGWNGFGITGLAAFALIMAVLMIPRVLDLALVDVRVEAVKVGALLLAGAVLWPSWRRAGLVVQAFFLGNTLPMTAIIGGLYVDSPVRLCNAYLLDDQQDLGRTLSRIAIAIAVAWLARAAWAHHGSRDRQPSGRPAR